MSVFILLLLGFGPQPPFLCEAGCFQRDLKADPENPPHLAHFLGLKRIKFQVH
jgi:hypothetical protein